MLLKELGQPVFQAGLHRYLTRHRLDTAGTDDLWAAIQEAAQEASQAAAEEDRPEVPDIRVRIIPYRRRRRRPARRRQGRTGRRCPISG